MMYAFLQVDYGNEFFMVNRAFKAIRRADVVLLMVDVEAGITDQVNDAQKRDGFMFCLWGYRL